MGGERREGEGRGGRGQAGPKERTRLNEYVYRIRHGCGAQCAPVTVDLIELLRVRVPPGVLLVGHIQTLGPHV